MGAQRENRHPGAEGSFSWSLSRLKNLDVTGWTGYSGQNLTRCEKNAFGLHPVYPAHPVNCAFDGFEVI
jgi:hypothetical protein